ncbi:hypothetical protein PCANC_17488 [Puccinia coronata f. sp. avenae]|uniref:Uncharacterized protein n=1 Tax=Puccinia coronata f. sp. avenae TaxID=200324 RepID=A0A2N5SS88_9BASI|nr:hypothetical protein PCANC_17488 [Puccinia coronata f. sp. avenae]PLW34993.1 hypothetical protein PCASD_15315 [Puccinia coronata f. sp. avenae]
MELHINPAKKEICQYAGLKCYSRSMTQIALQSPMTTTDVRMKSHKAKPIPLEALSIKILTDYSRQKRMRGIT